MLKRGLYQIYTGDAKGKTTAAVGLAVRARGAGLRVAFVQFIKGGPESSELPMLRQLGVDVTRPARETTGLLRGGITDEDRRSTAEAFDVARAALAGGEYDLVIMDEANVAVKYDLLAADTLADAIAARAPHTEAVTTGRGAPDRLRDMADLVTEMTLVKHPYTQGIAARKGIEY
jgi:cob(I)alamin adenosyltransferase